MNKTVQLNIRIPVELKQDLEEAARANGKNLSQEIIGRLKSGPTGEVETLKRTLVSVVKGSISFPGDTPEERIANLAFFMNIPLNDPDFN